MKKGRDKGNIFFCLKKKLFFELEERKEGKGKDKKTKKKEDIFDDPVSSFIFIFLYLVFSVFAKL